MNRNRAVLTAVVLILVVIAGWWLFRRGSSRDSINLLDRFDTTEKRPAPDVFQVGDIDLNGESKRAIAVKPGPGSRLIWRVRVPDDGWLRVSVGLKPEAWTAEGDGVLFMVGVSDGRTFEKLFTQHVDPFGKNGDRRWIPVMVDLSTYAGEEMQLIFNTYASEPGHGSDFRNDYAVWGAPEIVVR
jgi:hypothetical protein